MDKFDVIVIGGGPGGYPAAIRCAQKGLKVCLVEEKTLGGVCLTKGCIPTKTLVHIAREIAGSHIRGIQKTVAWTWPDILAFVKTDVVQRLTTGVGFLLKQHGITVKNARGTLLGPGRVQAGAESLEATDIILATGSSPCIPEVFAGDNRIITSDDIWTLDALPASLAIVGGGVIGCEFAGILTALGVKVSIYEMCEMLLPGQDGELVKILQSAWTKKGIQTCLGRCIQNAGDIKEDKIFLSIGRRPNVNGLAETGVTVDKLGVVADTRMRTSLDHVYAVGDVTGRYPYAYVATREGEVAADNITGRETHVEYDTIPEAVFTEPELGSCGLTEDEAKQQGLPVKIGRFPYPALGRAYAEGKPIGLAKIVAEESTGRILGMHIIGERATELVAFSTLAVKNEMKVEDLERILYCHPTFAESIMEAAADLHGASVHLPPRKR